MIYRKASAAELPLVLKIEYRITQTFEFKHIQTSPKWQTISDSLQRFYGIHKELITKLEK